MPSPPDPAPSSSPARPLSGEEWRADLYAGYSSPPRGAVSPDAVVLHDRGEEQAHAQRWRYGEARTTTSEFINGTFCHVDTGGRDRVEGQIIASLSPALNAYKVKYMARCGGRGGDREAFIADHQFVRCTPPPTDPPDADADPVRTVYAHCAGCVERGYHLATTDVSCAAFGTEPPPKRAYRDVAAAERMAAMTREEREGWEAEQARL